ncbi:MAG TPA: formate dehydrogenase accessory sulfurtransferase FdhD [Mycobacteriales bacterium]|nr:formate dehydrogenase accessory sulfurtransferase FdhD [Mycobacteriales bacterium]
MVRSCSPRSSEADLRDTAAPLVDRPYGSRVDGRRSPSTRVRLVAVEGPSATVREDRLATEEPLEIRVQTPSGASRVAVTMRTPGNDFELAAGFCFAEGMTGPDGIRRIRYCTDGLEQQFNVVTVDLDHEVPVGTVLERNFLTSSACGVCGTASIEALEARGYQSVPDGAPLDRTVLWTLPERLRTAQQVFASTGGLHAAGLFTLDGELVCAREDVGRHNALDKLVGWAVLGQRIPLTDHVLLVSGRTSYELVQKALTAGVSHLVGISAPSSLAAGLAGRFGLSLVGFLRGTSCNVYSRPDRVR